jgi:hypothetical protein
LIPESIRTPKPWPLQAGTNLPAGALLDISMKPYPGENSIDNFQANLERILNTGLAVAGQASLVEFMVLPRHEPLR